MPAGFAGPLPIGVSFIGGRWDEPKFIGLAYDFEEATKARRPPTFIPSIGPDAAAKAQAKRWDAAGTNRSTNRAPLR